MLDARQFYVHPQEARPDWSRDPASERSQSTSDSCAALARSIPNSLKGGIKTQDN